MQQLQGQAAATGAIIGAGVVLLIRAGLLAFYGFAVYTFYQWSEQAG